MRAKSRSRSARVTMPALRSAGKADVGTRQRCSSGASETPPAARTIGAVPGCTSTSVVPLVCACAGAATANARADRRARRSRAVNCTPTTLAAMARAFVGLGSNLGDRERTLERAVEHLGELPETAVVAVSSCRDTAPVGIVDQPRFLNGAVELDTALPPRQLLGALLEIERSLGRDRAGAPPGGPRTLDLDLLLYGDAEIDEPGLRVPHPRLAERRFVLEPLVELDPALEAPSQGPLEALLAKLDSGA